MHSHLPVRLRGLSVVFVLSTFAGLLSVPEGSRSGLSPANQPFAGQRGRILCTVRFDNGTPQRCVKSAAANWLVVRFHPCDIATTLRRPDGSIVPESPRDKSMGPSVYDWAPIATSDEHRTGLTLSSRYVAAHVSKGQYVLAV